MRPFFYLSFLLFLMTSCDLDKEQRQIKTTIKQVSKKKVQPTKAVNVKMFYCGYFAYGCEDYSEDSVYIEIIEDNIIKIGRRFSEAENPRQWAFSGKFEKTKSNFILNYDNDFYANITPVHPVGKRGRYNGKMDIYFNCDSNRKACSISGRPSSLPEENNDSSELTFKLKCNNRRFHDQSATKKDCSY